MFWFFEMSPCVYLRTTVDAIYITIFQVNLDLHVKDRGLRSFHNARYWSFT